MRLERTQDAGLVRSILAHPEVKPLVWEGDGDPVVPLHDSIYHLVAREEVYADGATEDQLVGVVAFLPVNSISWNPHMAILPAHRGRGTQALELALRWMSENTPCRKVVAYPPQFNAAMIRVFEKCGFSQEGLSPNSFRWRGALYGRVLMGKELEPCGQG